MQQEAQHMGAALADGFMERLAQYDAALTSQGIKTASTVPGVSPDQLQRVKEAAYSQAVQDMEKKAAEEFERGYNDQIQGVHKLAADIHYIGQQTASTLIGEARKSA